MENLTLIVESAVVLAAILIGVRAGGVGIGLWGGIGTALLVFALGEQIGSPPIDALLIIVAVILATSTVQAAGGIDWMVLLSARVIVRWPRSITVVAPLVSLLFAMGAGTSNVLFSLLPVIQEVSTRAGVRPSQPISMSVVATSVALGCSPVSAAMAAMITVMEVLPTPWTVWQILAVTVPSAVIGITVSAIIISRFGGADELVQPPRGVSSGGLPKDPGATQEPDVTHNRGPREEPSQTDPAGNCSLMKGQAEKLTLESLSTVRTTVSARARWSALIYFAGVLSVVVFGVFPGIRPISSAEGEPISTSTTIQLIMLVTAGLVALVGKCDLRTVPEMTIFKGGMVAAIAFFGLAWMIDTFLQANTATVEAGLVSWVQAWAPAMAIGVFVIAVLTTSQSTATRMIVPIGLAAGLPAGLAVGLWVGALGGIYLLPTNGLQIAAANLDPTGSTKLGRRLYDHSFFVPSLLVTVFTTVTGGMIGALVL